MVFTSEHKRIIIDLVFSVTKNGHTLFLPVWSSFGKNLEIEIETGICNHKYLRAFRASESKNPTPSLIARYTGCLS
jgi:formyltetrahydrofolate hydrolase